MIDFNETGGAGFIQLLAWIVSGGLLICVIYLCYTRSFRRLWVAPDVLSRSDEDENIEEQREIVIEKYYNSTENGKKFVRQMTQQEVVMETNTTASSQQHQDDEEPSPNEHSICAVCLETYKLNDSIVSSSDCPHFFHKHCLVSYMKKCKIEEGFSPCPNCRQPFLPRLELPALSGEEQGDALEMVERGQDPPGRSQ